MNKYTIQIIVPNETVKKLPRLKMYLRKKLLCEYEITHTRADGKKEIRRSKNYNELSHSSTSS